jgi:hypothetical protein
MMRIGWLEATLRPQPHPAGGIDPALQRAWLATLTDEELEFMAGVARHLEASGSLAEFDVPTLERLDRILATWELFEGD